MPDVRYFLHDFPASTGSPRAGTLKVSQADLIRAAATIGVTPFGRNANRAPTVVDMLWRSTMAWANLVPRHNHWERSESYRHMNPTEKGAVSYFLGQVQAKLAAEQIFGISTFAHYESYLEALGRRTNSSRPDFIGFDSLARTFVTVEAKGRFGKHPADHFVRTAKRQAQSVGLATTSATDYVYAQVAHFETGQWAADLHDPPIVGTPTVPDRTAVAFAHYWPSVSAINLRQSRSEEITENMDTDAFTDTRSAFFPEGGFGIGVPEEIAAAVTGAADRLRSGKRYERGAAFPEWDEITSQRVDTDGDLDFGGLVSNPQLSVGNDRIVCILTATRQ